MAVSSYCRGLRSDRYQYGPKSDAEGGVMERRLTAGIALSVAAGAERDGCKPSRRATMVARNFTA